MNSNEIVSAVEVVRRVLARRTKGRVAESIGDGEPVFGPGGVIQDSLDILDTLSEIEVEFGVSIPDEDLTEELFATVGGLVSYLEARRHA